MAKKNIHPEKQIVTVVMSDGTEYPLKMALANNQERLVLEVDPLTHPAWREDGERKLMDTGGRVSRFAKKYGDFM